MTIAPHFERFLWISSGDRYTCGLREDGTVTCWGEGALVAPVDEKFTSLSVGSSHTCGIRHDGSPVCWGSGYETAVASARHSTYQAVRTYTSIAVSSGRGHVCGLRQDGTPFVGGPIGPARALHRTTSGSPGSAVACLMFALSRLL